MLYDDNWPRIQTDVDDDRPARTDEVEYCENCEEAFLEGELRRTEDNVLLCVECWKAIADEA
jgi:formylmethanofuran dehydrogenase subunit E